MFKCKEKENGVLMYEPDSVLREFKESGAQYSS